MSDESTKGLTLPESLAKVIGEKQKLLARMKPQMETLIAQKHLPPLTTQTYQIAVDNFDRALVELDKGEKYYDAVYYFSRGCVNIGDMLARNKKAQTDN